MKYVKLSSLHNCHALIVPFFEQEESQDFRDGLVHITTIVHTLGAGILEFFVRDSAWMANGVIADPAGAQFALCIAAILVEHANAIPSFDKAFDSYVKLMLAGCQSPSPYVAQAATCGLGIACAFNASSFKPFLSEAIENLISVWDYEEAQADAERWGSVLDNVSSSCGKLALVFASDSNSLPIDQKTKILEIFVHRLPYAYDDGENELAMNSILGLLSLNDPEFIKVVEPSLGRLFALCRAEYGAVETREAMFEKFSQLAENRKLSRPS